MVAIHLVATVLSLSSLLPSLQRVLLFLPLINYVKPHYLLHISYPAFSLRQQEAGKNL